VAVGDAALARSVVVAGLCEAGQQRLVNLTRFGIRDDELTFGPLACNARVLRGDRRTSRVSLRHLQLGRQRRTLTACLLPLWIEAPDLNAIRDDRGKTTDHLPSVWPFLKDTWSGDAVVGDAGDSGEIGERELCEQPAVRSRSGRGVSIDGVVHRSARVTTAGAEAGAGAGSERSLGEDSSESL
jgi:hypothetical protein